MGGTGHSRNTTAAARPEWVSGLDELEEAGVAACWLV